MAKSKQFTDNMRKATLITLSVGLGASAVIPGMLPALSMKAEASSALPAEGASILTDAGDIRHYQPVLSNGIMNLVDGVWKTTFHPVSQDSIIMSDGKMYGFLNSTTSSIIVRFNDETKKWEQVGTVPRPVNKLIESANGNLLAIGGYYTGFGDYYTIYSSVGDDSTWEKRFDVYRSGSTNTNTTGAGFFHTGIAMEDEVVVFGTSMNWTNIMTSSDDINFKYQQQIYGNYKASTHNGEGQIVAVGTQLSQSSYGSIATLLENGKYQVLKMGIYANLKDVTYANGKYVAVGSGFQNAGVMYTSVDGISWVTTALPAGTQGLNSVDWDEVNQRFVAAGYRGTMLVSNDGVEWVKVNSGILSDIHGVNMFADPTARMSVIPESGNVDVRYSSLVEGASSYELLRNGEVIYSGTDVNFVDENTLGEQKYKYEVNVKDENGEIIGRASSNVTTPRYATFATEQVAGKVIVAMDYAKDQKVSYEVQRDGEVVYEGTSGQFTDSNVKGASNYAYTLTVKDENGTALATDTMLVSMPIYSPENVQAEETSPTSQLVSWTDDKNREDAEYFVQANPLEEVVPTPVTLEEGFESEAPLFESVGDWERTTLNKKDGEHSLRSAVIGHRGITTSTYTIDVPESVLDGKVSFDYMVSSEASYDWFRVVLNGKQVVRQAGLGTWKSVEFDLQPGENTLMFEYKKDGSGTKGLDAAFIDNLTATSADNGIRTSGWIQAKEHEFQGLTEGIPYEFTVVAKANGLESEAASSLDVATPDVPNPTVEVTVNVAELTDDIANLDLTNLENIAEAQAQLDAVKELVDALPESTDKDSLVDQVADLQEILDNAKALVEATQAVDAFIDALPEYMSTQEEVDEATAGLNEVQEVVGALVDSAEKEALVERLAEIEVTIQLAQDVLNATEAVFELMDAVATLETQEAIDEALALLENAKDLVSQLPADNTARIELEKGLVEAKVAINVAQAQLDVAKLADAQTQENVDKARESLEKVEDGAVKDSLLEKIELAQAVLDAKTLLAEIATREIDTTEKVDQSIADLKSTDKLIATLDGTFMSGEKPELEQAYNKAKKHIADEFLALLENNRNGKKEKLTISMDALHLLVQQMVAENPEITKGEIKGELQPLLASSVKGKTLNSVIAVYVN